MTDFKIGDKVVVLRCFFQTFKKNEMGIIYDIRNYTHKDGEFFYIISKLHNSDISDIVEISEIRPLNNVEKVLYG